MAKDIKYQTQIRGKFLPGTTLGRPTTNAENETWTKSALKQKQQTTSTNKRPTETTQWCIGWNQRYESIESAAKGTERCGWRRDKSLEIRNVQISCKCIDQPWNGQTSQRVFADASWAQVCQWLTGQTERFRVNSWRRKMESRQGAQGKGWNGGTAWVELEGVG